MTYTVEDIRCTLLEKIDDNIISNVKISNEGTNVYVILYRVRIERLTLIKHEINREQLDVVKDVVNDITRRTDLRITNTRHWEIANEMFDYRTLVLEHTFINPR